MLTRGKNVFNKGYISTFFSITKLTHATQFSGNMEEILKEENQQEKTHIQHLPGFLKAGLQRLGQTKCVILQRKYLVNALI